MVDYRKAALYVNHMVEYKNEHELDLTFHALADPTRRKILSLIAHKTHTVSELAKPFNMSLAAVSKHVNVLRKAGLVQRRIEGRTHYCSLDIRPLSEATRIIKDLTEFWEQQFSSLEQLLEQVQKDELHNQRKET